jgi:hypothetical protein
LDEEFYASELAANSTRVQRERAKQAQLEKERQEEEEKQRLAKGKKASTLTKAVAQRTFHLLCFAFVRLPIGTRSQPCPGYFRGQRRPIESAFPSSRPSALSKT